MIASRTPRLFRDELGASAIELALAAPILAAFVIGMTDMARGYSMKLMLEQASQRTIEQVEQQRSVAKTYNTAVTTEATAAMTAAGYTTGNTITPDSWVECSSDGSSWTRKTAFTDACDPNQMTSRYVKVTIARKFTPMFASRRWPGADANGDITVTGAAQVRIQ